MLKTFDFCLEMQVDVVSGLVLHGSSYSGSLAYSQGKILTPFNYNYDHNGLSAFDVPGTVLSLLLCDLI